MFSQPPDPSLLRLRHLLVGSLLCAAATVWSGALRAEPGAGARDRLLLEARIDQVTGKVAPLAAANLAYADAFAPTVAAANEGTYRWFRAAPCFRYVRCSEWLADGTRAGASAFSGCRVCRSGSSVAEPQWEALDHSLDTLVAAGLKPVLVCGGMPDVLAAPDSPRDPSGGKIGRPRDYKTYQALIEALGRHLEKTYGREEVRSWYFEVWDRPDQAAYWEGGGAPAATPAYPAERLEPFLRLYDHFAAGLAAVDPRLRCGGPGTAGDRRFLRGFLEHCARGENFAAGGKGARLDFISLHAAEPGARESLRAEVAKELPTLAAAPVFVTYDAPGDGSPNAAALSCGPAAAVRLCSEAAAILDRGRPDDCSFTEAHLVIDHFAGASAAIARLGRYAVPLPLTRAAMLLSRMGRERVAAKMGGAVDGFATRTAPDAAQFLVARPAAAGADPLPVRLRLAGLPKSLLRAPVRVYVIDQKNYNAYGDWVAAGKPVPAPDPLAQKWVGSELYPPTRTETETTVSDGAASVDLEIGPDSVALVTVGTETTLPAVEAKSLDKNSRIRRLLEAEEAYYTAAGYQRSRDFDVAEKGYLDLARKHADSYWSPVALATLVEMYDIDMRRPDKAEAARNRLLALPIDDFDRERLLRQRLVAAVRAGNQDQVRTVRQELTAIETRRQSLAYHPATPAAAP